ncbi:hypothetical protein AAFF_G00372790, partial [Aldrovandia affinis]
AHFLCWCRRGNNFKVYEGKHNNWYGTPGGLYIQLESITDYHYVTPITIKWHLLCELCVLHLAMTKQDNKRKRERKSRKI